MLVFRVAYIRFIIVHFCELVSHFMSLLVTAENFNEISIEFFNNFEILMKFYCSLS